MKVRFQTAEKSSNFYIGELYMKNNFDEFDFDDETELELLRQYAEKLQEIESKTFMVVPERMKEVLSVYDALKKTLEVGDVKVTCHLFEQNKSLCNIMVQGGRYNFFGIKAVYDAVKRADQVDIIPIDDGSVTLDFSFFRVALPVD